MIRIFIIALTVTAALVVRYFGLRLGVHHDRRAGTAKLASTAQQPSHADLDL
jgi:hypothetical protein